MARIVSVSEWADAGAFRAEPRRFAEIDAIFLASAATQTFASPEDRAAFHDLWLGRYLRHFPEWSFVSLDHTGGVSGYLAGSPVSDRPPLPGPDYFAAFQPELLKAFPAHIHVNVRADCRGQRVGENLVAALRAKCRAAALPGFHAVTATSGRAAHFFEKCGLQPYEIAAWRDRHIVMLGEITTTMMPTTIHRHNN